MLPSPDDQPLAQDLLVGTRSIAAFLGLSEGAVRHRLERGDLPSFKLGGTHCARKSTLHRRIADLEAAALRRLRT